MMELGLKTAQSTASMTPPRSLPCDIYTEPFANPSPIAWETVMNTFEAQNLGDQ